MTGRSRLLLVLVGTVAGLNVWHWWPADGSPGAGTSRMEERMMPEALRLQIAVAPESSAPMRRDLFQPKRTVVAKAPPPAPVVQEGPPPKTPEQLAAEAAHAELAQIKLIGIVFRGDKGEAFVAKGDQTFVVRPGDKVGERFSVEAIDAESVSLRDPSTQVSGKLPVSGR